MPTNPKPNIKTSSHEYTITKLQQLVDLNGDVTNFKVKFTATSVEGSPFQTVVANQSMLDQNKPLEFKQVQNGTISGEIVADKNVYQNYFLILKSDIPTSVTVYIEFQKYPDYIEKVKTGETETESPNMTFVIGVVIGIAILYYVMSQKESTQIEVPSTPIAGESLLSKLKNIPIE